MSGGLIVRLCEAVLAMFGVWPALLVAVGLVLFVSVPVSMVFFEIVSSMHPGSAAGYCQPDRWYHLSPRTHTSG